MNNSERMKIITYSNAAVGITLRVVTYYNLNIIIQKGKNKVRIMEIVSGNGTLN